MRILVIGAGPSGLVCAKTLREAGHEVAVVEASQQLGGTFENKRYAGSRMVSSHFLTAFSDFRVPRDFQAADSGQKDHLSLEDYVRYLDAYATRFGLRPLIRFGHRVMRVRRLGTAKDAGYRVQLQGPGGDASEAWDAIAVCSGLHEVLRVPSFPGASFGGHMLHSSDYKDPAMFRDKRVLVVGSGETGFDVAHGAATHGARSVALATRSGFVSVPASFGEGTEYPPLDCVIMNFATHAWESDWARRVGFHWFITTKISRMGFFLSTGSSWGFNQWGGKRYNMVWSDGRRHIVNKSPRCMKLINRALKRKSLLGRLYRWLDTGADDGACDVDLVEGGVQKVRKEGFTFATRDGAKDVDCDVCVLATGYRQRFPFLFDQPDPQKDDPLPPEHFIVHPEEPRLGFFGFVRPNVGAIPPMAELQAMWWAERLAGRGEKSHRTDYRLNHRLDYAVDYGTYMFVLAGEVGAAPSLTRLLTRPRLFCACAFGQAHVPIFRLFGPFASKDAERVVGTELFDVLLRRPLGMNLIFLVEALCFAAINGAACAISGLASGLRAAAPGKR